MSKPRLGVAAGNRLGGEAAAEIARAGGNAVDACLAAAIAGWVAEPFFASVAGSGFVIVRVPDGAVEVVDGNNAVPRRIRDLPESEVRRVYLDYSNGMYTGIGGASVAVPGILAAIGVAWQRHGRVEWPALFMPAIRAARDGIAFPQTSAYYLSVTWEPIWARYAAARQLFGGDGPMEEGAVLRQPELAEALEAVARDGPGALYGGALGDEFVEALSADGGVVRRDDLTAYTAEVRTPVATNAFGWRVDSNPPPAMGGALLTHMLALLEDTSHDDPVDRLRAIVEAESAAIGLRNERMKEPGDVAGEVQRDARRKRSSASTTHASAADSDGRVCAVTESNGYGAGLVVHGMLLNNTLGEEELNPFGAQSMPPGSRCHSNMAPTVATGPHETVGLGSPGADRIVGAVAQTIVRLAVDRLPLRDAVAAPRAHLASRMEGPLLCFEPGLPGEALGYRARPYDELHMFFGAVQAASVADDGTVDAAHDPRRSGATALV